MGEFTEWADGRSLVTLTETSQLLGVPIRVVYRLVELGEITGFYEPGRLMLSVASIDSMLERHTIYPDMELDRPHYFDDGGRAITEAEAFWLLASKAKLE